MALTLGQKAGWGLADMGIVVFVVVKQLLILVFLTAFLGVPVGIAGFVTTAVLIFDMITDPLVGHFSDRTNSRFGRRAPWMAIGAVVMAAGMAALFAVPKGMTLAGDLAWVIAFFGVATIGFTMVAIPFGAQAGEMTQDPRERSAMTGWRMGFASVGILVGGAVVPGLAGSIGYPMAAIAVSPLIIGAVWISLFATRNAPRLEQTKPVALRDAYALVFSNRAFMVLVALYGVMTLAIALITAGLPFAALYLIKDAGDNMLSDVAVGLTTLSLMFAAFVVGSIISQAVWVFASNRLGKLAALQLGLVLYMLLLGGLYAVLPSVNVTIMAGMFVLAGFANGSYQQIPWALYPDHMDVTRAESGAAIEGAFSAVWLFGQKLANALAPAVLGGVLAMAGWQETTVGVAIQDDSAINMLHIAITLIPAAILLVSLLGLGLVYRPLAKAALGN
jgi:GPH family glycoside/pentoside/hexuronide:cation symporter